MNDKDFEERLEKLEKLIYGTNTSNGILPTIVSIQNEVRNLQNQYAAIMQQISRLEDKLDKKLDTISKRLEEQNKHIEKEIDEINKRVDSTRSFVVKIATSSATIGFVAGMIISLLLHR